MNLQLPKSLSLYTKFVHLSARSFAFIAGIILLCSSIFLSYLIIRGAVRARLEDPVINAFAPTLVNLKSYNNLEDIITKGHLNSVEKTDTVWKKIFGIPKLTTQATQ